MKLNLLTLAAGLGAALAIIPACRPDLPVDEASARPQLPDHLYDYSLKVPPSFSMNGPGVINVVDPTTGEPVIIPVDNFGFGFGFNPENPLITDAGATLGRVLFYDPKLSLNNRISCGSCHRQELAFSDGTASSTGFESRVTPRNSMAIVNVGFNSNLFWDSRASSVRDLVIRPIQNHIEMGMEDMQVLEQKLSKVSYYPALFTAAFGSPEVTEERIGSALAQFVSSITTVDSKFDRALENNFESFTTLERMGHNLFFSARTNCSSCHAAPNFAAPDFPGGGYSQPTVRGTANTGLDLVYEDPGKEDGKFRIPSLRNIALTAPYMHDGRFQTLAEVIDFYDHGIQAHASLDDNLRNSDGSPRHLNLNALEKQALLAFLHTLTDETMLTDPKFSNPFQK
jgi:cytochrome c peroxidase